MFEPGGSSLNRRRAAVLTWTLGLGLAVPALLAAAADESPVADAAMRGSLEEVREMLQRGVDVNAAQGDGMTALHWAARRGDVELAQMLLYAGANRDAGTRIGRYTPLHVASRAGNAAVVATLLEAGSNAEAATTAGGARALHFASAAGSVETAKALLERGAEVNATEAAWGQTSLMFAAASNRVAALSTLLQAGADPAITSTVVDVPAREKIERRARKLRAARQAALRKLEEDENEKPGDGEQPAGSEEPVEGKESTEGKESAAGEESAAVAEAAAEEEPAASEELAAAAEPAEDQKTDDDAEPAEDQEPEEGEAGEGAAEELVPDEKGGEEGEELERPEGKPPTYAELVGGHGGLAALHYAAREGHLDAVLALLEAGADIDQLSAGDHTSPLLIAIINGHFDLGMELLELGADPCLASDAGATPLHAALNVRWAPKASYPQQNAYQQQHTTYLQLMEAVLEAGADPNARLSKHLWYASYNFDHLLDMTGATPFWRATYATDLEAMRLLIAHGADPGIPTQTLPKRRRGPDYEPEEDEEDLSGVPPVPIGGAAVYPIHAAAGAGYGERFSAHAHRHVPDAWLATVRYLVEELGADINLRDNKAYTPLHHAAARGDNEMIFYLVERGAAVGVLSRKGQTTADMANGPVQRVRPFPFTIALLEWLGSENSHHCLSC